nr:MAG TPA: hypothetical protein [Caudoviricetes sp.]
MKKNDLISIYWKEDGNSRPLFINWLKILTNSQRQPPLVHNLFIMLIKCLQRNFENLLTF